MALTVLGGCGGSDGGTEPETPRPTTLVVTPAPVTLTYIGATTTLTARILDQNGAPLAGSVTWASDDSGVASVTADGTLTAVTNGTTTVRATSGTVSGTAAVTVQQTVGLLTVVSGNAQSGLAGEPLAEAVVVRAKDLGGTAVAGAAVSFTPDAGNGTVSVGSATTDAAGEASTSWTMGAGFGAQRLSVSAGGAAFAVVTATSLSPVPLPDLVTDGTLVVQRVDFTSLDTVRVQATIRNEGDASSGQSFRVRLLADGAEIASSQVSALAAAAVDTLEFSVGPLLVGAHTLRLEVDPEGVVEELNESNNVGSRDVTVALMTVVEAGATITAIGATKDVELLYRVDLAAPASNLTVELSGGTGDVDLFMSAGERPATREKYLDCQSGSPTTEERCQVKASVGPHFILLHAYETFSGTTMKIILDGATLPFNIEVVFLSHGTARQDDAVLQAAARWMSIIPVDITDSDFSAQPLAAGDCAKGQPAVTDIVDDLRIYVRIDSIDGPSGTLAQAAPCVTRGLGHLPILGFMELDSVDLVTLDERGELLPVVLHEMGHVLGFGTIWPQTDYLHNNSLPNNSGADTYFDGPGAVAAFDAAGGTSYTKGKKVPVENNAGEGSSDSHWRESELKRELMTPFFDSGRVNPLSAITVRSLEDLGYFVDVSQADAFTGSFTAPTPASGASARVRVDLSGDVPNRPIVVVDQKGRVVAVRR